MLKRKSVQVSHLALQERWADARGRAAAGRFRLRKIKPCSQPQICHTKREYIFFTLFGCSLSSRMTTSRGEDDDLEGPLESPPLSPSAAGGGGSTFLASPASTREKKRNESVSHELGNESASERNFLKISYVAGGLLSTWLAAKDHW